MDFKELLFNKLLRRPYRLHVVDHGGKGPVIFFLHGIASSSTNWEHVVPLLKQEFRCITIDLLGFGNSPKPNWIGYTVHDHIKSIHATIRTLRIRQPYILVGHSMGSLLAARYAALHPKYVQKLALIAPPVYLHPEKIPSPGARRRTSAYLTAYRFIRTHKRITSQNVVRLARILPLPKAFVMDETTWLPFIRSLEHCIENQTIVHDIEKVDVPIDVFYGIFDQFIVASNVKMLATKPNVTLYPLRVDHAVSKRFAKNIALILLEKKLQ